MLELWVSLLLLLLHCPSQPQSASYTTIHRMDSKIQTMDDVAHSVVVLEGGAALLPCQVKLLNAQDKTKLVLWFKDNSTSPFYTYSASVTGSGTHYRNQGEGRAARSQYQAGPSLAHLTINPAQLGDTGRYRCRVDFLQQQTGFTSSDLRVVQLPGQPTIHAGGAPLGGRLTVAENQSLSLSCGSTGGQPAPTVSWWRGKTQLSQHMGREGDTTTARLDLARVGREHLAEGLRCRASNTREFPPLETSLHLDMKLAALSVSLVTPPSPLVAGTAYTVDCQVVGSLPPPTIHWWLAGQHLPEISKKSLLSGNLTVSSVRLTVQPDDSGSQLTCQAETRGVAGSLTAVWNITVAYPPTTTIHLGDSLDAASIAEGDHVYFQCRIQASPKARMLTWHHNGVAMMPSLDEGVIMSGSSLVIQGIKRQQRGDYSCSATNSVGEGISSSLLLDVKYTPACSSVQPTVQHTALHTAVQLICRMDGNPSSLLAFDWEFNTSSALLPIEGKDISVLGDTSSLQYTPHSELDYGTFLCWATNGLGRGSPCTILLLPSGPPGPPLECVVSALTYSSLMVTCAPAPAHASLQLVLEVQVSTSGESVSHMSSSGSRLAVTDLHSGATYTLVLWNTNSQGASSPVEVIVTTLLEPIKQMAETKMAGPSPPQENSWSPVLVAGFFLLLLLLGLLSGLLVTVGRRARVSSLSSSNTVSTSLLRESGVPMDHSLSTISRELQTVHQCVVSAADTCRREEVLDPPPGYRTDSDTVWVRSGV